MYLLIGLVLVALFWAAMIATGRGDKYPEFSETGDGYQKSHWSAKFHWGWLIFLIPAALVIYLGL